MITAIILSLYIIGIFVAYNKIKEWDNNEFEKVFFSIIWPLVLFLYGIHWLHNKS
jgi:hypothetical protein